MKPLAFGPAPFSDTMNRRLSIFVVLVLITVGSVCALFIHHDDVRSDVIARTPYSMIDQSASGILIIDEETYPYVVADAAFGVDLIQGDRSHCWITLSFSRSNFGPYNNLGFEYWTLSGTQAPEGSIWVSTGGNESKYVYDDPLTGTELTFHFVNNIVDRISFKGTTMNEFDGDLKYVTFDIETSFDKRIVFVNDVIKGSLPEPKTLNIVGEENGMPMSGTLSIVPLTCVVWNGGHEKIVASVTLDIPGTSIPDSILTAIVELSDSYGFIDRGLHIQYLDHDGNYVIQDVVYRLTGGDRPTLVLEGTVTSSALDSGCGIIEQTTLEFSYKVVR